MPSRILLVEDHDSLGYLLQEYLSLKGLEVTWARDGQAGLDALKAYPFDLCILDIMMPLLDGYQLAREIKALYPTLPFLFLSARSLKVDVLKGFHLGADDYIKKPVDEEELLARIQAILARSQRSPTSPALVPIGRFVFDPANQQLCLDQAVQPLTSRESALLRYLAERQGQLCRREDILKTIWGKNDYFNRKSMDVFISRLRRYLAADADVQLANVHGTGYILQTPDAKQAGA